MSGEQLRKLEQYEDALQYIAGHAKEGEIRLHAKLALGFEPKVFPAGLKNAVSRTELLSHQGSEEVSTQK